MARAQNVECRATETQPECHARLKCKPDEDLEECQERLRSRSGSDEDRDDDRRDRDGDRQDRDRGGDRDRGRDGDRDRGRDRDRYDRDDRGDRGDRGRDGRSNRRRGQRRGSAGSDFQANKTFGLGLEVGAPTGLTGKYFLSDSGAIDFGLGWIYRHYYYDDGLHIYADYLWHPVSLASTPTLELPLYIGAGLRFWEFEFCHQDHCHDGSAMGIRIPFGIAFDFNNVPLDIFIQLVPVIDFVGDDYADEHEDGTHLGIDLSAGIRFWFN